jgi:hypothetical protein
MAGLRYPGTVLANGWLNIGGATGGWSPFVLTDNWLTSSLEHHRLYLAPSRYSSVRKVIFSLTFQHIQTGGTLADTFSMRVAPSSTSTQNRDTIESNAIAQDSRPVVSGVGQIWSVNEPLRDAAFYALNGSENQLAPRQVANEPPITTDAQTLVVEFDRFSAGSADFFADWDAIVDLASDDRYIAYALGIQRDSLSAFTGGLGDTTRHPTIIGCQVTVVQAPALENNTCTYVPMTNGLHPDENFNVPGTIQKMVPFTFRAADWDGIESINWVMRQTPRSGANSVGFYQVHLQEIANNESKPGTLIDTHQVSPSATNISTFMRSDDIKAFFGDGKTYTASFTSNTGSGQQDLPWGWLEIIQKNCTKKVTIHPVGMGNVAGVTTFVPSAPSSIGDFRFASDQSLFDPDWYENMPISFFLGQRFFGGIDHIADSDTDQMFVLNNDLGADIPNSAFNLVGDEVSSTPDADPGVRLRNRPITSGRVNPLLVGVRSVLKMRYNRDSWDALEVSGLSGVAYTFTIPNKEFLELGPIFEIGKFDPEGCTSTAAGLGDSPGMLFLTNGSSIPKKFNPTSGIVDNAGMPTPFRDQEPSVTTDSVALSPDGGLTPGVYKYRYTLRNCCTGKESDPNPVDIEADANGETPAAEVTLNFSGVVIPADSQICEICIYRTIIDGDFPVMAKVGCFDPDDTSTFVDILSDSLLDFVNDSLSILNAPMPCVSVVAQFRNRLFGLGDIPQLDPPGTVSVTLDSDILEGDSETEFDRCVIGKFIQIEGDCTSYEVVELLAPIESTPLAGVRLKLDRPYEGITDEGLNYITCGHPNRLYISEPLEGECWPGINFLDIDPGDGDRLMGAITNFNRLVVCKRNKTYVVAFREQPILEIVVPTLISSDIGCVAPRSVAQVASGSVWLSDRGLALYDGRGVGAVPESAVMNDLFVNPENPNYLRRDSNGRVLGAAGVFYPRREQYLLLLPTVKTTRGASMLLVWDTQLRNVTLLEFCQEFLSIEVAKDSDGNERVYLGDTNGFVWIWDVGDTDGVGFPNATGTVRGTVTEAGVDSLTGASFLEDSAASFVTGGVPGIADLSGLAGTSGLTGQSNMGLAGTCVFWRPADAPLGTPWQSRFIYLSTPTKLFVTPNWGPDTPNFGEDGDEYMLGPINFVAEFKPSNYGTDDFTKRDWRQILVHEPEAVSTDLRTELLRDFQNSDVDEDTVTDSSGETGQGRNYDLGFGKGRQIRPVGRLVHDFMGVRLSNFAPDEPLTILNHLLLMLPRTSR